MTRRRTSRILGLALAAPLLAHLVVGSVQAAVAAPSAPAAPAQAGEALGGYTLEARGNGVSVLYDMPGALPIGTLVDVGSPEAQTRLATGPVGSALSGLGYPGPVILGGSVLLEQGGFDAPFEFPDYPFVIQTDSSGPDEVRDEETVPGSSMYAKVDGATVEALTVAGGSDADPLLTYGGSRARSTGVVESTADTATTVQVSDIVALGGLLTIESVTTELTATSDGSAGSSAGRTTVTGASLGGEPVEIGPDGIRFTDPPEGSEPETGGVLGQVGDALEPVTAGLGDLLDQAGSLNEILGQAGIAVRLAEPRATGDGPSAERVSEGLVIEFEQELGATPLAALFDAVPVLPDLPGAPVGPNDLVSIIQARQVSSISIGGGQVAATSSPAFELPPFEVDIDTPTPAVAPVAQGPSLSSSGPSRSPSPTPSTGSSGDTGGEIATGPISTETPFELPGIIGPGMIFAALLGGLQPREPQAPRLGDGRNHDRRRVQLRPARRLPGRRLMSEITIDVLHTVPNGASVGCSMA